MKKKIRVLVGVLMTMGGAGPLWAFQSVGIATLTAIVTTGGTKTADFTYAIRLATDPFGADQSALSWTNVDPLTTQWKMSQELIVINSTVTDQNGGIKIYTDNTASDAVPAYVDPTPGDADDPDSRAAGLLKGTSGTTSSVPLPMAWSIKSATGPIPAEAEPNNIGSCGNPSDPDAFQWLYMTDKSNWDGIDNNNDGIYTDCGESTPLALDAEFPKLINHLGFHFGQADTEFGVLPDGRNTFVFLQANFTGAEVLQSYQTTTIRIEAFIE